MATEFLERVTHRLATESDLHTRGMILEEALREYPQEQYFADELALVRNEQKIIQGITDRALTLQKSGYLSEAIEQWTHLKSLYPHHPGVDSAIEQCEQLLRQKREATRSTLQGAIDKARNDMDYSLARERAREALIEFPEDASFAALEKEISEVAERRDGARDLIKRAHSDFQKENFRSGHDQLRQALELAREQPDLTKAIAATFVRGTSAAVTKDLAVAESMLADAKIADPAVVIPKALPSALLEAKARLDLDEFRLAASSLESGGNFPQALRLTHEFLKKYPVNAEAATIQNRLLKAQEEAARKQYREEQLQSLRAVEAQARTVTYESDLLNLLKRAQQIASQNKDPDVAKVAETIIRHLSGMAQVRQLLNKGRLREAEEACNQCLSEFPQNTALEQWRAEIEFRQNERASEYLRQVERMLAQEPDLKKQEQILDEALREYPREQYFADELALVRNEQKIIESITDRALNLQKEGYISEALQQWIHLKSVYPRYPGIDSAIEHCEELLRKKRDAARRRLEAAIDKARNEMDYGLACERVREALVEFPEDPSFAALEKEITERAERRDQARDLIKRAHSNFQQENFQSGHEQLRQALKYTPGETDLTKAIAAILIRQASAALLKDPAIAESMLADAKATDPAVAIPKSLQNALLEAKGKRDLNEFQLAASSLESGGNFNRALRLTQEFLKKYPGNAEAVSIQNRLLKAQEEADKKRHREEQLQSLRAVADQARTVTYEGDLLNLLKRAQQIARQTNDLEVTQAAETVNRHLSGMAQVRQLIDKGRLREAEEACNRCFSDFPQNATLERWRAEIEFRQNERASEYLRQVEGKLAQEPDFKKQELILEDALREYPKEQYFADELILVRNKQSLLETEIARARELESKELYEDALREWESLRKTYFWYPKIEEEINRFQRAWELQRSATRNNWIARIGEALAGLDVDLAESTLRQASLELPGDSALEDLKDQIEQTRRFKQERIELTSRGTVALKEGRFRDGGELLRRATNIFVSDVGFRDWVLDLLVTETKVNVDRDWQGAEVLLDEVTRLRPDFRIPADLKNAVEGKRRETEITQILEQVEIAESGGDLKAADRLLKATLERFPADERLSQRRSTILNRIREVEVQQAKAQARQQTEEVRNRLRESNTKRDLSKLRAAYLREGLANSPHVEVNRAARDLISEIDAKILALPPRKLARRALTRFWYVPVVLALVATLTIVWLLRKPDRKGVEITKVEVSNKPKSTPAPPDIQISGNVAVGDILLDQSKLGSLAGGAIDLRQLPPGRHLLTVNSPEGGATIPVSNDSVAGLRVDAIRANNISVTAISTNDRAATLTTSVLDAQPVVVDGNVAGSTKNGSLVLPILRAGNHHLRIGTQKDGLNFDVMVQSKPSIAVLLSGGTATGELAVRTNVSGAELFVNGQKHEAEIDRNFRLILPADTYTVYAIHDGYLPSDPVKVEVGKGSETIVNLRLAPKPSLLESPALVAGTQIKVDGLLLDSPSGKLVSRKIGSGLHVIEITRQGFTTKRLERAVEPGKTLSLTSADLDLSPAVPDAVVREAEEWNALKASDSLTDLQRFQKQYPKGLNSQAVSERIEALEWAAVDKTRAAAVSAYLAKYPQSAQSNEARVLAEQLQKTEGTRVEQSAWDSVNKGNKEALQSFIARYPGSTHATTAKQLVADLSREEGMKEVQSRDDDAWKSVDKTDFGSIQGYLNRFPSGKHRDQAQQALMITTQKSQEAESVLLVLKQFAAAWNERNVQAILSLQPNLPQRTVKAALAPVREWRMTITPTGPPQIIVDRASVTCKRRVNQKFTDGTEAQSPEATVTYLLRRQASSWIIEDVK